MFGIRLKHPTDFPLWGDEGNYINDINLPAGMLLDLVDIDVPDEDVPNLTVTLTGVPELCINVHLNDIVITEF